MATANIGGIAGLMGPHAAGATSREKLHSVGQPIRKRCVDRNEMLVPIREAAKTSGGDRRRTAIAAGDSGMIWRRRSSPQAIAIAGRSRAVHIDRDRTWREDSANQNGEDGRPGPYRPLKP